MPRYHFDLGNSNRGPIGYCAVVEAPTAERAAEALRELLPPELEVPVVNDPGAAVQIEYVSVYFNWQRPTARDARRED